MLFTIQVNNKSIKAEKGETILSALNRNGIIIPTLCRMKEFTPTGACRMCVVEVEGRERLVTACSQPVEEWMKIKTHSPRVIQARKTIVELLLSNHPDDCLYCDRNLNCELQRLSEELNIRETENQGEENKASSRPVKPCNCEGTFKMHPLRKMRQGMRRGNHSNITRFYKQGKSNSCGSSNGQGF